MTEAAEKAPAKLNLSLDVGEKRPDGFHELLMVMESVELCDDVTVSLRDDGVIRADCGLPWLPGDDRNLTVKAARVFFESAGLAGQGADIVVRKRIPVGAGMAGGSTDAAAVLRALNRMTGAGFAPEKLRELGLQVGSDVPYCVEGGSALARGRGELLSPLPPLPPCDIVVCKPRFSISTAELFGLVDSRTSRVRPDTAGLVAALGAGDLQGVARRLYNVFEDVLKRPYSEVRTIRLALLDAGALGAVMTGTGSAVFGLFGDHGRALSAWERLSGSYRDCFLTRAAGAAAES